MSRISSENSPNSRAGPREARSGRLAGLLVASLTVGLTLIGCIEPPGLPVASVPQVLELSSEEPCAATGVATPVSFDRADEVLPPGFKPQDYSHAVFVATGVRPPDAGRAILSILTWSCPAGDAGRITASYTNIWVERPGFLPEAREADVHFFIVETFATESPLTRAFDVWGVEHRAGVTETETTPRSSDLVQVDTMTLDGDGTVHAFTGHVSGGNPSPDTSLWFAADSGFVSMDWSVAEYRTGTGNCVLREGTLAHRIAGRTDCGYGSIIGEVQAPWEGVLRYVTA